MQNIFTQKNLQNLYGKTIFFRFLEQLFFLTSWTGHTKVEVTSILNQSYAPAWLVKIGVVWTHPDTCIEWSGTTELHLRTTGYVRANVFLKSVVAMDWHSYSKLSKQRPYVELREFLCGMTSFHQTLFEYTQTITMRILSTTSGGANAHMACHVNKLQDYQRIQIHLSHKW